MIHDIAVYKSGCQTNIEGNVAAWVEDGNVHVRAFGVNWTFTQKEGYALADDIRNAREGGWNPRSSSFEVFEWNDDEYGIAKGEATLILQCFDIDDLADWLEGKTVCEFDDIPDYSEEGDIE